MQPAEAMRRELLAVFETASYPVTDPIELIPVMPDGPATEFEAGDVCLGAMELGIEYAEYQEYPYDSADALVDDVMTGLQADGVLE